MLSSGFQFGSKRRKKDTLVVVVVFQSDGSRLVDPVPVDDQFGIRRLDAKESKCRLLIGKRRDSKEL